MRATLADAKRTLAEAERLVPLATAHPSPAMAETLRVAADRAMGAATFWVRSTNPSERGRKEAGKIARRASEIRDRAETVRILAPLARIGTLSGAATH